MLNNLYIPNDLNDKIKFEALLNKYNITNEELKALVRKDKYETHWTDKEFIEIFDKIRKSFDK